MATDGWGYYAREIAAGGEDYFVAHGEEPGRWIGRGAEALGLSGEVDEGGLSRLFGQGCHPVTGEGLGRQFDPQTTSVAGFALSFSPPKSVSILWALASDQVTAAVRDGHDAAVAAALDFLQDHAAFTRRGHAGTVQEPTGGYLAAAFVHRTSRAGDPQLHTHVLVANKVQASSDGRWLSVDGRELYEVQKAAGMLYKAALRAELTARLGVAWSEVDADGGAEIMGVPDRLIGEFSKRRAQVEAAAGRLIGERESALGRSLTGDERAAVYQLAAYHSRAAKAERGETTEQLRARWRAEAAAAGCPPEQWLYGVGGRRAVTQTEAMLSRLGVRPSVELLVAQVIESLERQHSTWGRADVVEALTVVLPTERTGSAERLREGVEVAADAVLAHPDVVLLTSPGRPGVRHGGLRYSTWWTLGTEQAVLDTVEAGRTAGVAVAGDEHIQAAVVGLGADQADAVGRLCAGGERVVMVGPAGSGKSRTLGAARQAWEAAGIPVRGVAPSAVAAGVLTAQAAVPSETLARFLLAAAHGRTELARGEVIFCDEASTVSTRDLARLVVLSDAADAKVVLVGDHYQLGSVEAGGLFRLLANDAATAELTGIRRFQDTWEAHATRRLRAGDRTVIDEYANRGRIHAGRREEALDAAHRGWLDARRQGRSVVVMAADHETVDQLALRARATRVAAGQVEADGIHVGNQTVGVGDEIVTTRNDRRLTTTTSAWVRNGDRWRILARDHHDALLLASLDGRGSVTVPASYVHEHVALVYAVTVHKGQGVTVDEGLLVVDHATSAEHLYVGLTRGRHHNQACVIAESAGDEHNRQEPPSAADVLSSALGRSSGEISATETLRAELDHPSQTSAPQASIIEGLRQAHLHGFHEAVRRQVHRQASDPANDIHALTPTVHGPGL